MLLIDKKMVEDNMRLVGFTLNKYYPQLKHDDDIKQIAYIGLCKAVKSYDETKSAFSTYAIIKIRGEVALALRKHKNSLNSQYELLSLNHHNDGSRNLEEQIPGKELNETGCMFDFLETLSNFDKTIIKLLYDGYNYSYISKKLKVSKSTIKYHRKKIKNKYLKYIEDGVTND